MQVWLWIFIKKKKRKEKEILYLFGNLGRNWANWSIIIIILHIAAFLLSHINSHIIHLFFTSYFLFLNSYSPYFSKKKKKTLILSINPHLLFHFLQLFPSLFISLLLSILHFYLPLLSILLLHFIIFSFLYFDHSSPSMSFFVFNPYFLHKKLWVLTLRWFFI